MRVPPWFIAILLVAAACTTPDDEPELSSTEQAATWDGDIKTLVLISQFDQTAPPATVLSWAQTQMGALDTFIRANSYDRAWLDLTYRGPYLLSPDSCDPDDRNANALMILRETALLADPTVDFSQYDVVIMLNEGDHLCPTPNSGGGPGVVLQYNIPTAEPITGGWLRTYLDQYWDNTTIALYAHELGHVMGGSHIDALRCTNASGSPATFVHSAAQGTCTTEFTHLAMMEPLHSQGVRSAHYTASHKKRFGWLLPSEVVSSRDGAYSLSPMSTPNGLKMIEIPLLGSTRSHYTLEYRQPTGYDAAPSALGPTLSGVFLHVRLDYAGGGFDLDAVDLPPFETGAPIQLTPLPLATPLPGGGYAPSFVDANQGLAIYVLSQASYGALVVVLPSRNVALSSNGGTMFVPSQYSSAYAKHYAIDGVRTGFWWGGWWQAFNSANVPGGCWNPSNWAYVGFNTQKTIYEVDVFGLQDNFQAGIPPTPTMTSNNYGLRHFHVQYWSPAIFQWVDVPGGYITWNNKVWNKLTFPPITTQYVRVLIECAQDNWSRIVEVEAHGW